MSAERRAMWEAQGTAPPPRRALAPPLGANIQRLDRGVIRDPGLDPKERQQLRRERRRARIEAWRMGLDPLPQRPRWREWRTVPRGPEE
jgi:transposase InsO family protein